MKRAFITGITGQDGSYLAELLLPKDYEVHGIIRRASAFNTSKAKNEFGFEATIDLETGLEKTIHWYIKTIGNPT